LFSVVLTGFFRSVKEWLWLFDLFIVASFCVGIVALDQYLTITFPGAWVEHFMASSNGARLAATIGNSGYVGGYMVFGVFMSLFMALKRSQIWAKSWYILVLLLELFIAIQTQTRGAYLALALGVGISAIYLMWFYFQNKYLKTALITMIIAVLLVVLGIFSFPNSDFVKNQKILRRISTISLADGTAQNRLVTWGIGYKGFLEKPILGWGQENFYQVFDKYYTTKNTEQWFDRCHNMMCDRATTGGIIGLLSYLGLLLLPFWAIWKYYRKEYAAKSDSQETSARRYLTPIIFTILIAAYIIQNMFIFEALATYVPLIMVLSFVGLYSKGYDFKFWDNANVKVTLIIIGVIFIIMALPVFNLNPLFANRDFIQALSSQSANLDDKINAFEEVIGRGTMGNQEYRRHYFNFYEQVMMDYLSKPENRTAENDQRMAAFANKMEAQFNAQIVENSYSVSNYLLLTRFDNLSYFFDVNRLNKALSVSDRAISLSPGRPQYYYETATTNYYLGNYYQSIKDETKAKEQFRLAVAKFYLGASQNVNDSSAFDQLSQFLIAVSQNSGGDSFAKALTELPVGNDKISAITAKMIEWQKNPAVGEDEATIKARIDKIKSIIEWLLKADPKYPELNTQLESLKQL
jgi:O-antigen ligase